MIRKKYLLERIKNLEQEKLVLRENLKVCICEINKNKQDIISIKNLIEPLCNEHLEKILKNLFVKKEEKNAEKKPIKTKTKKQQKGKVNE